MIPLEHEFEAVCAVGCWRRGVAMQRPVWCWRAQRRYLETRLAGRAAASHQAVAAVATGTRRAKRSTARLRLVTDGGVAVQQVRR
jgi:hypothetical protein